MRLSGTSRQGLVTWTGWCTSTHPSVCGHNPQRARRDKETSASSVIRSNAIRNAARPGGGHMPRYQRAAWTAFIYIRAPGQYLAACVTLGEESQREKAERGARSEERGSMEINLVSRSGRGKTQRVSGPSDTGQKPSRTNEGQSAVIVSVWLAPQRLIETPTLPPDFLIFLQRLRSQLS